MTPNAEIRTQFEYSSRSVAGIRPENEDAWCAARFGNELVCAVADGIGGHQAGDVASALAIRIFEDTVRKRVAATVLDESPGETLRRAHTLANEFVCEEGRGKQSGMGTTLVSAWLAGGEIYLCNTGDSRCTLVRSHDVRSLTKDHSLVQDLVDKEVISLDEAASHPMKNVITHSLGGEFLADVTVHAIFPGDTIVLSSDGLHDFVSREVMTAAGGKDTAWNAAAFLLEEAAKTSTDNITLIVVRVHGTVPETEGGGDHE